MVVIRGLVATAIVLQCVMISLGDVRLELNSNRLGSNGKVNISTELFNWNSVAASENAAVATDEVKIVGSTVGTPTETTPNPPTITSTTTTKDDLLLRSLTLPAKSRAPSSDDRSSSAASDHKRAPSNSTLQIHAAERSGGSNSASLIPLSAAIPRANGGNGSFSMVGSIAVNGGGGSLRRRVAVGKVRLVGGRNANEGNVEVFYMGRWGSVCDDEWDIREAHVVCGQLGYPKAEKFTQNSQFGLSRKRIWMDNLYCYGDEKNITSCPFDGWGNHDCTAQEAAGVVCVDPARTTTTTSTTAAPAPTALAALLASPAHVAAADQASDGKKSRIRHALPGPLQLRIIGGRVREEGRVEVRLGDGPWGLICGDGWGIMEAMTTCKSLGLGHAQAAVQSSFFGGHHLPMVLSGVKCTGREASLADCNHDQMGGVFCPGRTENIAGVICTEILPDLIPDHTELERSAYLEDRQLFFLQCAMEENCLARSAYRYDPAVYGWQLEVRRLLRFTARITNIGNADFRPFIPKELWQWHMCHMHYHSMEVFANFDVIDGSGRKVAEGHKASFCLEDNMCNAGVQAKYVCANYGDQGISVGCTDVYLHTVDCQWIDITDVKPGVYFLKVSINPDLKVPEITYDNNAAICNMYYNSYQVHIWNCTVTRP